MNYEETQYGFVFIIGFVLAGILMIFAYVYKWGNNPISQIPFMILSGVFAVILALFYKLEVRIENRKILIIYGIGLIRIKIEPDRYYNSEEFKVPWYYGLGIRITPGGMLYNLRGDRAVIIELQTKGVKKTIIIGTADPKRLKIFLNRHFAVIKENS